MTLEEGGRPIPAYGVTGKGSDELCDMGRGEEGTSLGIVLEFSK